MLKQGNQTKKIEQQINQNLKRIGFTEKENYVESDFVDTIGAYFQSKAASDESELWNDCLNIVAEKFRSQDFQPTSKVGRIGWQFVNSLPDSETGEQWNEVFHALNKIFNGVDE